MAHAVTRSADNLDDFDPVSLEGSAISVSGLGVEIDGRLGALDIGARTAFLSGWLGRVVSGPGAPIDGKCGRRSSN